VKTAAVVGAVVVVLVLNVLASSRIVRSEVYSQAQRAAWLLLVWLAPLVGAILALQVSTEVNVPAPVAGSSLAGGPKPGVGLAEGGNIDDGGNT
jgi:hypothetical protein